MATKGTALLVRTESWPEYVSRVTDGVSRRDIALAADINPSGVSRWLTGVSKPSAEKVVAFARGLQLNPIEALVAAGYLDATEVDGVIEVTRTRSGLSDDQVVDELKGLADELKGRLLFARSAGDVIAGDQPQQLPPGRTRIIGKAAAGKDTPARRDQQSGKRHQLGGR